MDKWIEIAPLGPTCGQQLVRGGSAPAQFWSLTWAQVRKRVRATADLDAGRAALEDPALWFYGPAKIIAWGRRC